MAKTTSFSVLGIVFVFLNSGGCGGNPTAPVATSGDEVQRYLDEHPELKEPKPEVDNTILTGQ